jgi:hypothetical protein
VFQALSFSLKINFDKCLLHEYKLEFLSKNLFRTAFSKIEIISIFLGRELLERFGVLTITCQPYSNLPAFAAYFETFVVIPRCPSKPWPMTLPPSLLSFFLTSRGVLKLPQYNFTFLLFPATDRSCCLAVFPHTTLNYSKIPQPILTSPRPL